MKPKDLQKRFGAEYPAAIVMQGIRIPLRRENRFSRFYHSDEHKMGSNISRFMDGSASITAAELEREWASWPEHTQTDFCQSSSWLDKQSDFPEMLRFIMQHGDPEHWSGVALSVASQLPHDEAFDVLVHALHNTDIGRTSNVSQAIGETKHPHAEATLRNHLTALWSHPAMWNDDEFLNWVSFDATTCIAHLIKLGATPSDFTEQVRLLSAHVCSGNRDSCRNFLSKHYSWLK